MAGGSGGGKVERGHGAQGRQRNGSILFTQTPSSLVITAVRGFGVQLQARLFERLCVRVCVSVPPVAGKMNALYSLVWL